MESQYGVRVRITLDSWVPGVQVSFKDSALESDAPTHVSSLINLHSYAWDVSVIRRLFSNVTANTILALERPSVPMDDFVYWKLTPTGYFSVKSAYASIVDKGTYSVSHLPSLPACWWKCFWGLHILPSSRFLFGNCCIMLCQLLPFFMITTFPWILNVVSATLLHNRWLTYFTIVPLLVPGGLFPPEVV